jgi:spectinomycin phosphotransferase
MHPQTRNLKLYLKNERFVLMSFCMNEKIPPPKSIIDSLSSLYCISITSLKMLSLGADINAFTYKAESKIGQSYFVKLKYGHEYEIGPTILDLLEASGIEEIIPPIKTIDGKVSCKLNDFTLTLYPFIKGENGFSYNLTDDQWVILGKIMQKVHQFDTPISIKNLIRKETYSDKFQKTVRALDLQIDENLNLDESGLKLKLFMKKHRDVIHHLINRAEALRQKIVKQSHEFVLCHSDIHGGNVLIDENGSLFIIDWDDPIMAPKERDLMFIGGGVANVWNQPHEEKLFYKGYGKSEINQEILAYYRYERIVQDIAEYGEALLLSRTGGEKRTKMLKQFQDMFEPNGVVDIACKTDKA